MRSRAILGGVVVVAAIVAGCSSTASTPGSWGDDGGAGDDASSGGGSGSSSSTSSGGAGSGSGGGSGSSGGGGSGGSNGSSGGGSSGASSGAGSGGGSGGSSGGSSGSGSSGGPITCPGPGTYTKNGGSCGTERWNIKTGTDSQAAGLSLVPQPTTIAALVALPAAGGGSSRESPTETTLWQLTDVTLQMIKLETDSDYHHVVSDGTHTMIVEVPYPSCTAGSPWACFMTRARSEDDAKFSVSSSPQYPAQTVTIRGFGFFDYLHGQTGVAPNGIELHPVLQICFGKGCTPT